MSLFQELLGSFLPSSDGFVFMWTLALVALTAAALTIDRLLDIGRRTDVDAGPFADRIKALVREGKLDEALRMCVAGGKRALPRILGAGVRRAQSVPEMVRGAMEEETLHMVPLLEKRLGILMMLGNVSTLVGLMGTIYGLILSFQAVAHPEVAAVEKSSLLAAGISTAMNTTLLGLMISVPCILIYSLLRSRIDHAVGDIDRYAVSVLKLLVPAEQVGKTYKVSGRRIREEVDTEPNIAPMMNLMVILIPLLLTSAEFVKIGAVELKLPEASARSGGGGGDASEADKEATLDLGVVITSEGFNLYHYFREEPERPEGPEEPEPVEDEPDIPRANGEYDFVALNGALAEVKRRALREILAVVHPSVPEDASLIKLYTAYAKGDFAAIRLFRDHENVKVVAEDTIKYQTVVSVMDAARGRSTDHGKVTMFPNVSLAGGVVQ